VFAIQDEIAETIVKELRSGPAAAPARSRSSFDVEAHDSYLKGVYALHKWTEASMDAALDHFRDALARDPGLAPAHVALAEGCMWLYSGIGIRPAHETVPQARRAVEQALKIDALLGDAHRVRASIAMSHDWDRVRAEEGLTRALELGPGSAPAHLWNAWRLAVLERQHDRALAELAEAERLDPLDLQLKTQIGYVHYFHHDFDRAVGQFQRVIEMEPSFAFAHYALGDVRTQLGRYDEAFASFQRAIELGGRSVNHVAVLGYAHGLAGHRDRASELLSELMARSSQGFVSPMWIALVHLGLSDHDSLFQWLNRAFEGRDGSLVLVAAAVEFDPVRRDPRFQALLGRMGLGHLAVQ
jgi:tetratricopeptide (TPR) repeat protein